MSSPERLQFFLFDKSFGSKNVNFIILIVQQVKILPGPSFFYLHSLLRNETLCGIIDNDFLKSDVLIVV